MTMAQRIVTVCDQHQARGEDVSGTTWTLAVQPPGGRLATYRIDACPECAKPFVDLAAFLAELGQPVDRKPRGQAAIPDVDTPEAKRTCPVCQMVSTTRTAMRQHLRVKHGQTMASAGTDPLTCPECGDTFGSPQGLGAHRSRTHGVKGARGRKEQAAA